MKLSHDKKHLIYPDGSANDAEGVEKLIRVLVDLRSQMIPAAPRDAGGLGLAFVQGDPDIEVIPRSDGQMRLITRTDGIGWIAYDLNPRNALELRDFLIAVTSELEDGPLGKFVPDSTDSRH